MNTLRVRRAVVSAACFVAAAPWAVLAGEGEKSKTFSAAAYAEHVRYLASNELSGRRPGTEGIEKAAQYIAERFREAGLEGAGDGGTFFQEFSVNDGRGIDEGRALLEVSGLARAAKLNTDWVTMPFSKDGEVEGPLAFVGYGIEAPDEGYNDYADFDAADKVLLMFRFEPRSDDPQAALGGERSSDHALFKTKAKRAADHGAKAVIIVNPPGVPNEKDELYPFSRSEMWQTMDVPMVSVTRELAEAIVKQAGLPDLKALQGGIEKARKPASRDTKLTVKLNTAIGPKKTATRNVIGMLKGDGSTDEIIVVGAHYDHLGLTQRSFMRGDNTRAIHNGADDNASGTSGVLELARALGHGPRLRRNIVFMTFSAEEMGLLGSRHFVDNPTFDLTRVKAMVNLDMIGRFGQNKFEVYGADTGTGFDELVKSAAAHYGIEYKATPRTSGVFGQSDHASFYRKNIPVLFPFTGLHRQYHQPEDDWELIDAEGATRVLDMVHELVSALASMEQGPEFIKPGGKKKEGEADKPAEAAAAASGDKPAAAPPSDSDAPVRKMPSARLGIMPGYAQDESRPGLLVDGVTDDGPAKKAGIEQNDRIVKIGEFDVKDIESYMEAMSHFKAGDLADVVVDRNGLKVTIKVTFTAAGPPRGERK